MVRKRNRTANKPNRVARQNDGTATRQFRGTTRIFMQSSSTGSQNGVESGFSFATAASGFIGSDFISENFEQYSVTNVQVLFKPSAGTLNNGDVPGTTLECIKYQNSVYSLMNNTQVMSFVDYDTFLNPTFTECLTRPNVKLRALAPNNWTMIASYAPKTVSNQAAGNSAPTTTFNSNMWLSTENMDTQQFGLRGVCYNPAPCFDTQDNVASVDVMIRATIRMRGPKNQQASNSLTLTPLICSAPRPDDTNTDDDTVRTTPEGGY